MQGPQETKSGGKAWLTLAKHFFVPAAVLVVIIAVFFRGISPADILANFLKIPPAYLLAFIGLWLLGSVLRAWQYSVLLSGKLSRRDIFLITLVRNFSVDLLPGRAAALVFYSWLTRKKGVALEEGASSFVISIFYDAIALAMMLGGLLVFLESEMSRGPLVAGMAAIFILSALVIFHSGRFLQFLLQGGWLRRLRLARIEAPLRRIHDYLEEHGKLSEKMKVIAISLGVRICKYIYNFLLFEGVLHLGVGLKNFSLFSFGLAATELSTLFPIQGPAGFGTWELVFSLVFSALRIPADNIKEAGIVIHITSQAWEYAIGLLALAYLAFSRGGKRPPDLPAQVMGRPTGPDPSRNR